MARFLVIVHAGLRDFAGHDNAVEKVVAHVVEVGVGERACAPAALQVLELSDSGLVGEGGC
jgi:hypothetical protein